MTDTETTLTPLVVAQGLQKSFGANSVLTDATFEILPGTTGLLGANGAGKTTTLSIIMGLNHSSGGRIKVLGQDPWLSGKGVRQQIGYAPEHHQLDPTMPANAFVTLSCQLHGIPRHRSTQQASDALGLVGLGEERFRPMGTMSTGQRQRVKVAQAVAHDPKIVILDEPTDGLDPHQREAMLNLISNLSSEHGLSVIVSSHLLGEVERVCDNVVILGGGKVTLSGRVSELSVHDQTLTADGAPIAPYDLEITTKEAPTDSQITAFTDRLESSSHIVEVEGQPLSMSLVVRLDDDAGLDQIRDACVEHGIGIVSLKEAETNLEGLFMESMS